MVAELPLIASTNVISSRFGGSLPNVSVGLMNVWHDLTVCVCSSRFLSIDMVGFGLACELVRLEIASLQSLRFPR